MIYIIQLLLFTVLSSALIAQSNDIKAKSEYFEAEDTYVIISNVENDTCFVFVKNDTEFLIELKLYYPNDTSIAFTDFLFEPNQEETRLAKSYNELLKINTDYKIQVKDYDTRSERSEMIIIKDVAKIDGRVIKIFISDILDHTKYELNN